MVVNNIFARSHPREGYPRVGARYKFSKEFNIHSGSICNSIIFTGITHSYIIYIITYYPIGGLIISLNSELKRPIPYPEKIVHSRH